jgi:hypothetical protein
MPNDICLHFNSQSKEIPEITGNRYYLELMHYLIAAYPDCTATLLSKDKMMKA